jgi:hypothetical protein
MSIVRTMKYYILYTKHICEPNAEFRNALEHFLSEFFEFSELTTLTYGHIFKLVENVCLPVSYVPVPLTWGLTCPN